MGYTVTCIPEMNLEKMLNWQFFGYHAQGTVKLKCVSAQTYKYI